MPTSTKRERPIIFSAPMVWAILEGRKTQARRPILRLSGKGQITEFGPSDTPGYEWHFRDSQKRWHDVTLPRLMELCRFGVPGDRLWVRETWRNSIAGGFVVYRADPGRSESTKALDAIDRKFGSIGFRWRSPIHMPRWASRITLEIEQVRVQRVQDVSEADAAAEGCRATHSVRHAFATFWDSIHGPGAWERNDFCWAIAFRRVA